MDKICITGATGFLGGYLVRLFSEKGYSVVAFGRNAEKGQALLSKGIRFVQGHLEIEADVDRAVEGCHSVVHAGALSSVWGPYDAFYKANVKGTENVLNACHRKGVSRLVFISSPSIYTGPSDRLNIKEADVDTANDLNFYIQTKILAEAAVTGWQKGSFEKVIIRPRGLFGIGDASVIPRLMRANEKFGLPLFNGGQNLVDITYVENVAHSIWLAVTKPGIDGGIYNISNDEPMAFKEILELFLSSIGSKPRFINMKFKGLFRFISLVEAVFKALHIKREPLFTRYTLMTLGYSQTLSIEKAKEELGYKPLYSIKEGIAIYAAWYRENHTKH
ncbi:MAG: NAD-dependent epimerase/dehydratase family protein [Spirochaetales bacterium]|nr:NAD-dependent epimerase/dehydratase family protein [Spirochaetales bacterium]